MSASIASLQNGRDPAVLEDPRGFVFLSIRAMAETLHTDTATTLRSIPGMGFLGYPEFHRYLHDLTIAHATSLDSMLASTARDSDIPSHVRDSLDQDQKNFTSFRNTLDTEQLARLAQRMWSARRIILLGGDLASALVFYLEHHLVILGLPVFAATSPGRVVTWFEPQARKISCWQLAFVEPCGRRSKVCGRQKRRGRTA
jgi:DNA-binding MurR/RpiR family transcriptional regulator